MPEVVVFGISFGFPELSRSEGQIAHVLLTRSPLVYSRRSLTARLACVKHAASVRPEPGSNSPLKMLLMEQRYNFSSTLTNYLLTNKLSELIPSRLHASRSSREVTRRGVTN